MTMECFQGVLPCLSADREQFLACEKGIKSSFSPELRSADAVSVLKRAKSTSLQLLLVVLLSNEIEVLTSHFSFDSYFIFFDVGDSFWFEEGNEE